MTSQTSCKVRFLESDTNGVPSHREIEVDVFEGDSLYTVARRIESDRGFRCLNISKIAQVSIR